MAVWNNVNISYVLSKSRIDSEFYRKEDVELEVFLNKICNGEKLKNIAKEVTERFNKNQCEEFQYNDIGNTDLISGSVNKNIIKSSEAPGRAAYINQIDDVLISSVRPNRNANAIISENKNIQVGSNGFCNIRSNGLDPNYIFAFTKTKYFIATLVRATTSSMYPAVSNKDILNVPFFIPGTRQTLAISEKVQKSRQLLLKSQKTFNQSSALLEQELGLNNFARDENNFRVTQLTEMSSSKRFDAQCFKPEFLQYELFIRKNKNYDKLSGLLTGIANGNQQEIQSNGKFPYMSIKDISGVDIISKGNVVTSKSAGHREDLLLAVTGATIGKIGIIHRYQAISFSGDVIGLKVNKEKISPWYLLAVLNSQIGKTQFNRWITGSTNGHLSPNDVRKIIIPRLSKHNESLIEEWLKKSIENAIESETILKQAIEQVEELIEEEATKENAL